MVGLCGVLGEPEDLPTGFADTIRWRDDETSETFADDGLTLSFSFHELLAGDQPAQAAGGDVLVWVWGDVYGHGADEEYTPRKGPSGGSAHYCAELYETYGIDFVTDLNGDFVVVLYDRAAREVTFVTDRVGTRPIYYARPDDETLVISSQAQSMCQYPGVGTEFDLPYLYEYFQLRRVFGVETPLQGIREFPPASVVTVSLEDGSIKTDTYWRPRHRPIDEPFDHYLDRFVDTFQTVIDEWVRDDLDYGLLLSGGSDSRLVRAALDRPVTTFHATDWMSREAKVAQRASEVFDDEFVLLERDPDYEREALERNPPLSNFSGWFDQAYFTGFEEEITDRVDVLISGLYADMLFGGGPLDTWSLQLGPLGNVSLPVAKSVNSVSHYVRMQTKDAIEPLPYFRPDLSIQDVVADDIHWDGDSLVSHGVRYESLRDMVMYSDFYPMGADTDAIFSRSLMQMRPYRTPFLDNRLLDLQQQVPVRYLLRRKLVDQSVTRLAPELAAIPHARTGVPLDKPFSTDFLQGNVNNFWRKHIAEEQPPEPYLNHKPWPDRHALLRTQDFPVETIVGQHDLFEDLPFLDYEGALACYRDHVAGAANTTILYALLTFLGLPVVDHARTSDDRSPTGPDATRR